MRLLIPSSIFICIAGAASATGIPDELYALYSPNIAARLWRAAVNGPPSLAGWPQYTQGAQNNTPVQPHPITPGTYINTPADGWTAGFLPWSLWALYDRFTNLLPPPSPAQAHQPSLEAWQQQALAWTTPLQSNINLTNTHDVGFLSYPLAAAVTLANQTALLPVLAQMSSNLAARFVPAAGVIRSWDTNNSTWATRGSHADSVLVIIDNMMNLALLAQSAAATYTHNGSLLTTLAAAHANRTRDNHVRADGSTFHVCDYSGATGARYLCRTAQGLADGSTWARGQAWAIYGFAQMYAFTRDESYLATAVRAAEWFAVHLPGDGVPYWDFDARQRPAETPRDSSAAAIAASGLLLLQEQIECTPGWRQRRMNGSRSFADVAEKLLEDTVRLALAEEISFADVDARKPQKGLGARTSLTTPGNATGTKGFESILMHATADLNSHAGAGMSWDSGLVYGDYYLIEAGNRLLRRKGKQWR